MATAHPAHAPTTAPATAVTDDTPCHTDDDAYRPQPTGALALPAPHVPLP